MTDDIYMMAIVLLLPITGSMVMFQTNPYHALVIRGILGALAALVYALFGAADVALTEALVGTMLSITLYAIAVRSSMRMRLGILGTEQTDTPEEIELIKAFRDILKPHHVYLEIVPFSTLPDLRAALENKDLHGTLVPRQQIGPEELNYDLHLRIRRLAEIFQPQLPKTIAAMKVMEDIDSEPSVKTVTLKSGVES